nr:exocyst complex component EXO70B1-like isoform X2 [Ipomoea trifida]
MVFYEEYSSKAWLVRDGERSDDDSTRVFFFLAPARRQLWEVNNDLIGDSSHRLRRGGFDDETLRREALQIHGHIRDVCRNEIKHEITVVGDRIEEAVVSVFSDLESSIRNDIARIPVPGGAVHPLTRYIMNYLEYAFEYKDTLEHIFQKNSKPDQQSQGTEPVETDETPFSIQIVTVMDLLDANLQTKSITKYKSQSKPRREIQPLNRCRLEHIKNRHGINLIAADDVDDHHEVSSCNEPKRLLQSDQNIIVHLVPEGPVPHQGHRKVAYGVDKIRPQRPLPHGNLGGLLRGGWNGGLNFKNHRVSRVRK